MTKPTEKIDPMLSIRISHAQEEILRNRMPLRGDRTKAFKPYIDAHLKALEDDPQRDPFLPVNVIEDEKLANDGEPQDNLAPVENTLGIIGMWNSPHELDIYDELFSSHIFNIYTSELIRWYVDKAIMDELHNRYPIDEDVLESAGQGKWEKETAIWVPLVARDDSPFPISDDDQFIRMKMHQRFRTRLDQRGQREQIAFSLVGVEPRPAPFHLLTDRRYVQQVDASGSCIAFSPSSRIYLDAKVRFDFRHSTLLFRQRFDCL